MASLLVTVVVSSLFAVTGCVSSSPSSPSPVDVDDPTPMRIDVGGHALSVRAEGTGTPTVVFESGGGNDGSVWSSIAPQVRAQADVRTIVYDRAGLGASDPVPEPYSIETDARALRTLLDHLDVRGGVVLVAHSYGGYIASLVVESDPRVVGLVLVDAAIPGDTDAEKALRTRAKYREQYEVLRELRPEIAPRMIAMMEAYPDSIERVNRVAIRDDLPMIDIVADDTLGDTPEEKEAFRRAHAELVAGSTMREAVVAENSSHHVARDRPDVVIDAVVRLIETARDERGREEHVRGE